MPAGHPTPTTPSGERRFVTVLACDLAEILSLRTDLAVKEAEDHEVLNPGTVYIAPPGRHLTVGADGLGPARAGLVEEPVQAGRCLAVPPQDDGRA